MDKNSINLTEGSIWKSLVALSVPIIFANILQTAYQLTDTFWVGRLGTVAMASVSLSFPVIFLIISLGGGLTIAGTILVSQYKGKNDHTAVEHVTSQTLLMVLMASLILSVIGYLMSPLLVRLMGVESEVFPLAVSYLSISFVGMIFVFFFMAFQSLMRGVGDVMTPIFIVLGTVLLNLILDPLFIFGYGPIPAFNVAGAAIATIATQGLAAVIGLFLLFNGKLHIRIRLKNFKPDLALIKKIFYLGLPSSIEQSTRALGMTIMIFLVSSFGTLTLAAYGIGGRILSFIIIPALGLSMATSTLVGQNIGAGKIKRAEKIIKLGAVSGFVILSIVGVIVFVSANYLVEFFIPGEIATIETASVFIRTMALTFGFIGIQMVLNGAFIGSGSTLISMIMSLVSFWLLQFPLAYILSKHTALGESGLWWSFPLTNIIGTLIAFGWFARGDWKKKKITEEIKLEVKTTEEVIAEEGAG